MCFYILTDMPNFPLCKLLRMMDKEALSSQPDQQPLLSYLVFVYLRAENATSL